MRRGHSNLREIMGRHPQVLVWVLVLPQLLVIMLREDVIIALRTMVSRLLITLVTCPRCTGR